jgi:hypothetical protein
VEVSLASGERHLYVFRRATVDALVLERAIGPAGDVIVPKERVTKVVRKGVKDSAGDGTLLGAVVGVGAGLGLLAIMYANACDTCDPPAYSELALPAAAVFGGGGAALGYFIDRAHEGSQLLYPVPATKKAASMSDPADAPRARATESRLTATLRTLRFGRSVKAPLTAAESDGRLALISSPPGLRLRQNRPRFSVMFDVTSIVQRPTRAGW